MKNRQAIERDRSGTTTSPDTAVSRWVRRLERSQRRKAALEQAANIVGFFIAMLLLLVQFAVGALRRQSFSDEMVTSILVVCAVTIVMLFVAPDLTTRVLTRFMYATGRKITDTVVNTLLVVVFVLSLPFAALLGRRSFARVHPGARAWVRGDDYRGVSTWTGKQFDQERVNRKGRSTVVRTVVFFIGQRNWFLLAVVLVLMLIASFLALASSPVLTPFIYPLF